MLETFIHVHRYRDKPQLRDAVIWEVTRGDVFQDDALMPITQGPGETTVSFAAVLGSSRNAPRAGRNPNKDTKAVNYDHELPVF